jgi:serine/threonine protein kinase
VVAPHFPCLNTEGDPTAKVSKLFGSQHDMLHEWYQFLLIKNADPDGDFTVPVVDRCTANVSPQDAIRLTVGCGAASASLSSVYPEAVDGKCAGQLWQLVQEYGGLPLSRVLHFKPPAIKILRSLTVLITRGLPALSEHSIWHRDISLDNIVLMHGRARLIDFGAVVTNPREVYDFLRTKRHVHASWPPECHLLLEMIGEGDPKNKSKSTPDYVHMRKELEKRVPKRDTSTEYVDMLETHAAKYFAHKFDVFSMGLVVAAVVLGFPTTVPGLDVWIKNCTRVNAYKRWDAYQAAVEWQQIM